MSRPGPSFVLPGVSTGTPKKSGPRETPHRPGQTTDGSAGKRSVSYSGKWPRPRLGGLLLFAGQFDDQLNEQLVGAVLHGLGVLARQPLEDVGQFGAQLAGGAEQVALIPFAVAVAVAGVKDAVGIADSRAGFPARDGILGREVARRLRQRARAAIEGLNLHLDHKAAGAELFCLHVLPFQAVQEARQLSADLLGRANGLGDVGAAEAVGGVGPVAATEQGPRLPPRDGGVPARDVLTHRSSSRW